MIRDDLEKKNKKFILNVVSSNNYFLKFEEQR